MKYLITGGAGFIGSNFIKYMLDKYPNDQFVCLDLLTYASSLESLKEVIDNPNLKFIYGDICDEKLVFKLFREEQFDYVVNFAAESHVDRSYLYEDLFHQTNVIGTEVLLKASAKYHVKRFHQISTDEVYGELQLDDQDEMFYETSILNPTSPYSKSKADAEGVVLDYFIRHNLNVTISRSGNNFGIYQHPEKLIPKVIKMALNKEKITIYGDGLNVRDWLYVADHCAAIDLILHRGKNGEIYNIGANNEKTNLWIVNRVLEILGIKEFDFIYTKNRPNDDLRYALNCDKIKRELGWNSSFDFNDFFIKTVLWYKDNLDWIEHILSK